MLRRRARDGRNVSLFLFSRAGGLLQEMACHLIVLN